MIVDPRDAILIEAVQAGLPLVPRPYAAIGEDIGMSEQEVIERLSRLKRDGVIKRLGVVIRHRKLGYRANAMVVWDVPDEIVSEVGSRMSAHAFVTLCYRRPRLGDAWPYNLFCMIHGKDKGKVARQIEILEKSCGLVGVPRDILFSRRCFKQCGARYRLSPAGSSEQVQFA